MKFVFLLIAYAAVFQLQVIAYKGRYVLWPKSLLRHHDRAVDRKQPNATCTLYSEEHNARISTLGCQENFQMATEEEIQQNRCKLLAGYFDEK